MTYSALVLIPVKPAMHPALKARMLHLAGHLPEANPTLDLMTVLDYRPEASRPSDCRPWSKVTRIRNRLIDTVAWQTFTHIVWIDADVVDYPADLPTRLIETAPDGIAAPMVFVEKTRRFYDVAAFTQRGRSHIRPDDIARVPGRNLMHDAPHWDVEPGTRVVPVDSVGCVYSVNTDVYRFHARHADHPAFTDHFPICETARLMERSVVVNRDVEVFHANLPDYGEEWH